MEGDHRVWPPDPGPPSGEPWNPRLRRTAERVVGAPAVREDWESLPPSARLHGTPADPGVTHRIRGRRWKRRVGAVFALVVASGLVAGLVVGVLRLANPAPRSGELVDSLAGVTIPLPPGWVRGAVPPVTGFTSVARNGPALVMARPVPAVTDARQDVFEASELYSRLLLKGDRVTIVEDRSIPGGHTRALRAEYQDVVNRPAYLRVTLLTRSSGGVLLVGLLQPEDNQARQGLDTLLTSVR
ncbi:MAG: hypothetical protein HOY71_32380 [Nonomuraea sp.]|nr:hypothetical protein [Nonomuraea sp.]